MNGLEQQGKIVTTNWCLYDVLKCLLLILINFIKGYLQLVLKPVVWLPRFGILLVKEGVLVRPKQWKLVHLWLPGQTPEQRAPNKEDVFTPRDPLGLTTPSGLQSARF